MNARKLFGSKQFYKILMVIAVPIMIQNGITNFVSLLDNIMVGNTGTEQLSGVAISNQLLFVFNLCIFGVISGASIFSSQFYGKRDYDGMRHAMRFKMLSCTIISTLAILLFISLRSPLINMYLQSANKGNKILVYEYGESYLLIMLIGLLPFTIAQIYSGTLREMYETMVPMIAGIVAIATNLIFNYILIFGKFGAPALGVNGAAIATVLSRFVEMFIVVIYAHRRKEKYPFLQGVYKKLTVPKALAFRIIKQGSPLMINETMWAAGMALMTQCYSLRGDDIVAALSISSTISNLFNVVFIAMGSAIAIILGPLLGASKNEEAMDTSLKLISFSTIICVVVGVVMGLTSSLFPKIYEASDIVKDYAASFILISACCMPLYSFANATYFTLRSGGKTLITFLFDSGFTWVIAAPVAFILSRYTNMPVIQLYITIQLLDIIKCTIGLIMVRKGIWLNNLTD